MSHDLPSRRWLTSLAVAALGHGALLAAGLSWAASPASSSGAPVFAVEIATAPPAPAPAAKPAPPEAKPEPPPKPAIAEVPLPRPKPPAPKPKPQPQATTAAPSPTPSAAPEPEANRTAAPVPGANAQAALARATSWQGELLGRLEQFKRYPHAAQWKRRQGTAIVAFTIDREGKLWSKRLNRSSGSDELDAEALALLDRAQPLPPPPESIPGERIELVVPIQFYLKR